MLGWQPRSNEAQQTPLHGVGAYGNAEQVNFAKPQPRSVNNLPRLTSKKRYFFSEVLGIL